MPFSKSVTNARSTLGCAMIKDRFKSKGARRQDWVPPADAADLHLIHEVLLKSVTAASDLDEFLSTATLAGTEFQAERYNVRLIEPNPCAGVLTDSEQHAVKDLQGKHKQLLRIPRRPLWTTAMTPEELDEKEREGFLEWRKQLGELTSIEALTVTPYEKNIEVWKQLWRVLEKSDVVVQIVDCRNPLLYWCEDLTKYVRELDLSKDNVILLNKADLLPEPQREAWARFFKENGMKAVFFSAIVDDHDDSPRETELSGNQRLDESADDVVSDSSSDSEILKDVDSEHGPDVEDGQGISMKFPAFLPANQAAVFPVQEESMMPSGVSCDSKILTREELLMLFRTIHDEKKTVVDNVTTIGFVGYPNVGKSSTLNCLMQHKRVSVSATPGKTKHFQTMYVDSNLMLCDSPGLVMPSFAMNAAEMICSGILPIDQMRDHIPPVNLLCSRIPRHVLESHYGISMPLIKEYGIEYLVIPPPTAIEFLNAYASKRGFVTARGIPDTSRSARLILKDYVSGKLLYCFGPPNVPQDNYFRYPDSNPERLPSKTEQDLLGPTGIISTSKSACVDRAFFADVTAGIHKKRNGIAVIRGPVPATEVGKTSKRHGNRKKKEKLRRIYHDLDIH